jgi:hypothetical protein
MRVLNALQIKNGVGVGQRRSGTTLLTRPLNFVSETEKDEDWAMDHMDWLEEEGINQIRRKAPSMLKKYRLAQGVIDRSDYIPDESCNEHAELIDLLTRNEENTPSKLKFYPIIPNVMRILLTEFAKRRSKLEFRAIDTLSQNEIIRKKTSEIEEVLMSEAYQKQLLSMMEMGYQPDDEEVVQALSADNLKKLPEIEEYYRRDYKSDYELWANVQHAADVERFCFDEKELIAYGDYLTVGEQYWHYRMMEDDYEVELWNPVFTFSHKSVDKKYVSEGNFVGNIQLMPFADAIDAYGYLMGDMDFEDMEQRNFRHVSGNSNLYSSNTQNDGSMYDSSKSYEWNTNLPGVAMRQYLDARGRFNSSDFMDEIINGSGYQDPFDTYSEDLVRVSTMYWISQRKVGILTEQLGPGMPVTKLVTEQFSVTHQPIYNTTVFTEKSELNLVYGQHVNWFWIKDLWGGVKISPNMAPARLRGSNTSFEPIYLGIDSKKPSRMRFQPKGYSGKYSVCLPVEGLTGTARNSEIRTPVDLMTPSQLQFNMVNNQIADIMIDEKGQVMLLDHNALPKNSMGEEWGHGNLAKAYAAMQDFGILPLDTVISNTENALNFSHYQVLNFEETNRLLGRIQLAAYFKQEAYSTLGINPQRIGGETGRQTAKGVEENLNASYNQTETWFIEHCDHLMPRVHQMRTNFAQYYHSSKSSFRLQVLTSNSQRKMFEFSGEQLNGRDIHVYAVTKSNRRETMRKLESLAINNNTTGGSLNDLGSLMNAESLIEMTDALARIEQKQQAALEAERAHEKEIEQMRMQEQAAIRDKELAQEKQIADDKNKTDIITSEIKAAGYGSMEDINANQQSDYLDALDRIQASEQYRDTMDFKREQERNKIQVAREQLNQKMQDRASKERIADKQLQVARENKNKYDVEKKKKANAKK